MGTVFAVNHSCANFFGFQKQEINNNNVNMLMPFPFNKIHDDILRNFITNGNTDQLTNREKTLYGKNKYGYIFQFMLAIKPVYHALKDGLQFIGIIRKEKLLRTQAYLILNDEGVIKELSPTCLTVLGIDLKMITL